MAARLFLAAVLGLLQLSLGTPSTWTARLLSFHEGNVTNVTETKTTTTAEATTTTAEATLSYHRVYGKMTLDLDDPERFRADPNSKLAIAVSLASQLTGVLGHMIDVASLSLQKARRLVAGRGLANQETKQIVLAIYHITLSDTDAIFLEGLADSIIAEIKAIKAEDMQASLQQAFDSLGINVTLAEVVMEEPLSQEIPDEAASVTFPFLPSPSPSPSSSPSPSPSPSPSTSPISSPSASPSSLPSPSSSPRPKEEDEDDGSIRPGSACMVFGLLALLRTTQ